MDIKVFEKKIDFKEEQPSKALDIIDFTQEKLTLSKTEQLLKALLVTVQT